MSLRRPDALVPVLLAAASGLAACGEQLDEVDQQRAQRVVETYARAFASQDGVAACRVLTAEMQQRYREGRPDGRDASCPDAFARSTRSDGRDLRPLAVAVEVGPDGDLRGLIRFSAASPGEPGLGGEVALAEEDGAWRIDEDLSCITASCDP